MNASVRNDAESNVYLSDYKKYVERVDTIRERFEQFATKTDSEMEKRMTYTDMLHSIVLSRFQLKKTALNSYDSQLDRDKLDLYKCSFLGDSNGLISFSEYRLILELLQVPSKHFQVAFYMFDVDQNGNVDRDEFLNVIRYILHDEPNHGASKRLLGHFFGSSGRKQIGAERFSEWIESIKKEILQAEFNLYSDPVYFESKWFPWGKKDTLKDQSISMKQFAATLISSAAIDQLAELIPRVMSVAESKHQVDFHEFCQFHLVIERYFSDIIGALSLSDAPGDSITIERFIKAAKVVGNVDLHPSMVQTLFYLFSTRENGTISELELRVASSIACKAVYGIPKQLPSKAMRFLNCITSE